jgi:Ca2+-binding RTX toxin-like protein
MRARIFNTVAAIALASAAPTFAGTATSDGFELAFTAAPGEANYVLIWGRPDGYRVIDLGAPLTAGDGCTQESPSTVRCVGTDSMGASIDTGDMNDFASLAIFGEATLSGGDGNDELEGGSSDDHLFGGPGDDTLEGGFGSNVLDGGPGADVMSRGEVAYTDRAAAVTADADGETGDDGEAGEGDTLLTDVAGIVGGSAGDTLTARSLDGGNGDDTLTGSFVEGGPGNDVLAGSFVAGGPGNDQIHGLSVFDDLNGGLGNDTITAGGGGDWVVGAAGNDVLHAGPGHDTVFGSSGVDTLVGGPGRDGLFGGADADTIQARDQALDRVFGGAGTDRARVDRRLDRLDSVERLF